jgi:GxxExxY protein
MSVAQYTTDLPVGGSFFVELKAVEGPKEIRGAQYLIYLTATGLRLCLPIDFSRHRRRLKRLVL